MKKRSITKGLKIKVYKYLECLNKKENEGQFGMKGESILNKVPQHLREEVQRGYYGNIISQIPFFTKNFTLHFLDKLALNMKELNLAQGESLFNAGSTDSSLFFLSKGTIERYLTIHNKSNRTDEKVI